MGKSQGGMMTVTEPMRILITGAAGQISYSLIFKLIHKSMDTLLFDARPIELYLQDLPIMQEALLGLKMEIDDCAFQNISKVMISSKIDDFLDMKIDYAILVGAKPRGKGMERKDLLEENAKIFVDQAHALDQIPDVKVLMVGNPCNTNALVLKHNTKNMNPLNIRAMMRLDQNRAVHQIAKALKVGANSITNLVVWGNHSPSMVADFTNAKVNNRPIREQRVFFEQEFLPIIQKRGASIINARGASSAASAANAVIDSLFDWQGKTKGWYSAAIYSQNNTYGIDQDLYFSFAMQGNSVVNGVCFDDFIQEKIKITEKELIKERDAVLKYL